MHKNIKMLSRKIFALLLIVLVFPMNISIFAEEYGNEFFVSPGDPSYFEMGGEFLDSNLKDYNGKTTRYSAEKDASVTWEQEVPAGKYELFVYKIVHETSDKAAKFEISNKNSAGVTSVKSRKTVNYTMGVSGWVSLGIYDFETAVITLSHTNGNLRAGSIQLLKEGTISTLDSSYYIPGVTPNFEEEIIVSPKGEGYSETGGFNDSALPDYNGMGIRYSGDAGGKAIYKKTLPAGDYEVYVYRSAYENSSTAVPVEVKSADGSKITNVDMRSTPSTWVSVGRYTFSGEPAEVIQTVSSGILRAASVRFVPYFSLTEKKATEASITDIEGSSFKTAINVVNGLGIITAVNNMFQPDRYVTKAELMAYGVKLFGIEDKVSGIQVFSDVPSNYPYAADIYTAYMLGFAKTEKNGVFKPDEIATMSDAFEIIKVVLGYGKLSDDRVISITASTRGVSYIPSSNISRGALAQMFYNIFDVNIKEVTVYLNDNAYKMKYAASDKEVTMLWNYHKVYKVRGIVTENKYTTATGYGALSDNSVKIDNTVYKQKYDIGKYFGMRVLTYVKEENEEHNIIFGMSTSENKILELYPDDLGEETKAGEIYQKDKNDNSRKLRLSANVSYIYNGIGAFNLTADELKPKAGYIRLLDNNGDGSYDFVFITNTVDRVVSQVDTATKRVLFKYSPTTLTHLDFYDQNTTYIVKMDNEIISFSDIKAGYVLSIGAAKTVGNKAYAEIFVSKKKLEGKIDEVTQEKGREYVRVKDKYYYYGEGFKSYGSHNKPEPGRKAVIYFDVFDNICDAVISDEMLEYAYLMGISKPADLSKKWRFKVFTHDNKFVVIDIGERCTINKIKYAEGSNAGLDAVYDFTANEPIRQLIKFELDLAGEMLSIKTADPYTAVSDEEFYEFTGMTLPANFRTSNQRTFNTQYITTAKTLVFLVPPAALAEETLIYEVRPITSFTINKVYSDIKFYNIDRERKIPIIVMTQTDSLDNPSTAVVTAVKSGLDNENEPCVLVNLLGIGGNDLSFPIENGIIGYEMDSNASTEAKTLTSNDLASGDFIQYVANKAGRIVSFRRLHALTDQRKDEKYLVGSTSQTSVFAEIYAGFGNVTEKSDAGFYTEMPDVGGSAAGITGRIWPLNDGISTIFVNHNGNAISSIKTGKISEIILGDSVLIHNFNETIRAYIVYRDWR